MRKMLLKLVAVVFFLTMLSFFSVSLAQNQIGYKINGQAVEEGERLQLFNADLKTPRLEFEAVIPAESNIVSLEISLDDGRTWDRMKKLGGAFLFKYRPDDVAELRPTFLVEKEDGTTSIESPHIVVFYQKDKPEDAILQLFERMETDYENENKIRFMDNIASNFPNRVEFEEAIQQDFNTFQNIRMFYRVDSAVISPNQQNAIYQVLWKKNWQNTSAASFSDEATIGMNMTRQGGDWKVAAMRDNAIFGSTLVDQSKPDLKTTNAQVTTSIAGQSITVVVENVESKPAENIRVEFYMKDDGLFYPSRTLVGTQTITRLEGNSSTTLTQGSVSMSGTECNIGTVIIDPLNAIDESNENNNQATDSDGCP